MEAGTQREGKSRVEWTAKTDLLYVHLSNGNKQEYQITTYTRLCVLPLYSFTHYTIVRKLPSLAEEGSDRRGVITRSVIWSLTVYRLVTVHCPYFSFVHTYYLGGSEGLQSFWWKPYPFSSLMTLEIYTQVVSPVYPVGYGGHCPFIVTSNRFGFQCASVALWTLGVIYNRHWKEKLEGKK